VYEIICVNTFIKNYRILACKLFYYLVFMVDSFVRKKDEHFLLETENYLTGTHVILASYMRIDQ